MSGVFGGGDDVPEQYSAYKNGDYMRWEAETKRRQEIDYARARGDYTGPDGYAAAPGTGTPAGPPSLDGIKGALGNGGGFKGAIQGVLNGSGGVMDDAAYNSLYNKLKQDPGAATEASELMRQGRIGVGKIGIDKSYKKFDDGYYGGYKDTYNSFYTPELDRQFTQASGKMAAALAGRGIGQSTVAADKGANLARDNANARTDIANQANDAAAKLRGQVESSKSNMYALNEQSADPQAVNARAAGEATALVAPPTFNPLGQVFASALAPIANYASARGNAPGAAYRSPFASGSGSGRVVG